MVSPRLGFSKRSLSASDPSTACPCNCPTCIEQHLMERCPVPFQDGTMRLHDPLGRWMLVNHGFLAMGFFSTTGPV